MTTKSKKKASTALALATRVSRLERVRPKKPTPDAPETTAVPTSGRTTIGPMDENIDLGTFGLVEVTFSAEEEAILARPCNLADIRVLPSGIVYLPHIVYTRWLNDAFGRTGWALRPLSKPSLSVGGQVIVPYHLMIHGKPVAFCYGEQDYHANNRAQSYGDALEATHASALRRACKHLGMALELWDREFGATFLDEFAIEVEVTIRYRDGDTWKSKDERQWRLRSSVPLKGEQGPSRRRDRDDEHTQERRPAKPVEPTASHPHQGEAITDKQVMRLYTIARKRGRLDAEIKAYLLGMGYASSREIRRRDYDTIVTAIEHPGALPAAPSRDPGSEG